MRETMRFVLTCVAVAFLAAIAITRNALPAAAVRAKYFRVNLPSDLPCPADPPSRIVITKPGEPGIPLLVSGIVIESDKKTPVPGAILYVYHTDARGLYAPPGSPVNPRLFGCMRAGAQGQYEFRTIEPGHYPAGGVPMHVHVKIWATGHPEYNGELRFEGDPALGADDVVANTKSGTFSDIRPLERRAGVLLCRRDFVLQR